MVLDKVEHHEKDNRYPMLSTISTAMGERVNFFIFYSKMKIRDTLC